MTSLEEQYNWYMENVSEDYRRDDEAFIELQLRYSEELMDEREQQCRAIFDDPSCDFDLQ
jgi:hypothetical protein